MPNLGLRGISDQIGRLAGVLERMPASNSEAQQEDEDKEHVAVEKEQSAGKGPLAWSQMFAIFFNLFYQVKVELRHKY